MKHYEISSVMHNSPWTSDVIWRYRPGTTLSRVMAWCHRTITWINADLSSVRSQDIELRPISHNIPQPSITRIILKPFIHDDVIKWKHFPRYWPFVRGIHRAPGKSPHKGQWRGALMFSLICVWINGWVNTREADDLRCHRAHYDVTVMITMLSQGRSVNKPRGLKAWW